MKKRKLSIILLILFLGQQLHSAVWAMPMDNMHCVEVSQSSCDNSAPEPMEHSIDNCELCFIACQAPLMNSELALLKNTLSFLLVTQSIDAPLDAYPSNNYRPPIYS
jgi:hypothetical protein